MQHVTHAWESILRVDLRVYLLKRAPASKLSLEDWYFTPNPWDALPSYLLSHISIKLVQKRKHIVEVQLCDVTWFYSEKEKCIFPDNHDF